MEVPVAVRLPPGAVEAMRAHAAREAPRECCGMLVGLFRADRVRVDKVVAGRNLASTRDLYELAPEDFVSADAAAERRGLAVVGFYHSHPRGPGRLSQADRARAWPGHVYLLISPETRSSNGVSAWIQAPQGRWLTLVLLEG